MLDGDICRVVAAKGFYTLFDPLLTFRKMFAFFCLQNIFCNPVQNIFCKGNDNQFAKG